MTLFLVLTISILLFFLIKPYESFREVRRSSYPVTILTTFMNVTGEGGCAKLYTSIATGGVNSQQAIFPALPEGMPAPDDGEYAYHDNVFQLTGFAYNWVFSNKITGSEWHKKSRRFDVIKWKLFPPYAVWVSTGGEGGEPTSEMKYEPLMFEFKSTDYSTAHFKLGNYVDCLATR